MCGRTIKYCTNLAIIPLEWSHIKPFRPAPYDHPLSLRIILVQMLYTLPSITFRCKYSYICPTECTLLVSFPCAKKSYCQFTEVILHALHSASANQILYIQLYILITALYHFITSLISTVNYNSKCFEAGTIARLQKWPPFYRMTVAERRDGGGVVKDFNKVVAHNVQTCANFFQPTEERGTRQTFFYIILI